MKRTWLVVVGVLVLAVLVAWSQRFAFALDHIRTRAVDGAVPSPLAWSILDDFPDRPELEAFVRERLLDDAREALESSAPGTLNPWSLLGLSRRVYERQPDRVDEEVMMAALVVECREDCTAGGPGSAPVFETLYWKEEVRASAAFTAAMRSAALAIARSPSMSTFPTASYVAIAGALADGEVEEDGALAAAIASFVLAADRGASEARWLADAVDRIAGPQGGAAAWAKALAGAPAGDLPLSAWNAAIDTLRRSQPLSDDSLAEAVVAHCVRRSQPPADADDACIDLGLAWGGAFGARLRTAAAAETSDTGAARALLAAHERARSRTWQHVIADWRQTPPADGSIETWQYSAPLERRRVRETALLLAAGAPAFPAVAALYRTTGDPEIINDAAFVLSQGSPRLLSAAVMERIEEFRLTAAAPIGEEDPGTDLGTDLRPDLGIDLGIDLEADLEADLGIDLEDEPIYDRLEGRRVAAGLLALEGEGRASTRIHPLILALSIPAAEFSKHASDALRRTLDASEFADALFGFLAIRDRYLVSEVDVYRNALISYDGVGPAIERNLAQLLADARGIAEEVPWILKVIGVSALGRTGGASACPLLERYAEDSGSYLEINRPKGNRFARSRTVKKRFDELAASALDRITACGA